MAHRGAHDHCNRTWWRRDNNRSREPEQEMGARRKTQKLFDRPFHSGNSWRDHLLHNSVAQVFARRFQAIKSEKSGQTTKLQMTLDRDPKPVVRFVYLP